MLASTEDANYNINSINVFEEDEAKYHTLTTAVHQLCYMILCESTF